MKPIHVITIILNAALVLPQGKAAFVFPQHASFPRHTQILPTRVKRSSVLRQQEAISNAPTLPRESKVAGPKSQTKPVISHEPVNGCNQRATPSKRDIFLIHKGRSAAMIKRSPCIAGVTLCKGWSPKASETFYQSVQKLVDMNPILTGRVKEKRKHLFDPGELQIQAGAFPSSQHNFVNRIQLPAELELPNLDELNATEIVSFLQTRIFPLLEECELTSKQIKDKLPVFSTTLLELPEGYAIYSMKMSHAVGDGVTFFQLLKELSMLMSNVEISAPIEWNSPLKATHEFYPDSFTPRDVEVAYGFPFMLGLFKNFPYIQNRHQQIMLFSKQKVTSLKRELRQSLNCTDLSSNDVITAALCEANRSSDIFVFTENARGIKEGIPRNAGGNLFWEIPVSRECCAKPDEYRRQQQRILRDGHQFYKPNQLPFEPFVYGRVGRLTSLASITEKVVLENTKVVCTLPYLSFIKEIPLDVAVIFRFNNDYWGVLHNFANMKIDENKWIGSTLKPE